MKVIERDVVVVGGGPGGSTCAAFLARAGVDVLILDKETFPREKPCGDCQSGVTCVILNELGWLDGLREISYENHGIILTSPDYTKLTVTAPFSGMRYDTPRRIYDDFMVKHAVKEGAELLEECWVYDVIKEDGYVRGVKAKYQGQKIEIRAKMVIGADGAHSIVAQKIGMFPDLDNNVAVVGRCYYENVDMEPYNEIHFDGDVIPGYVWIFPEKDKLANVGLGFTRDTYPRDGKSLQETLEFWINKSPFGEKLRGKKRIGEFRGWRIPDGVQRMDNYVPGCMLVGDAASMVMPSTGEGIGPAMVTGKLTAQITVEALKQNDFSGEFLRQYPQMRDEMYDAKYKSIKAFENSFANGDNVNAFVHKLNDDAKAFDGFRKQWFFEAYEEDRKKKGAAAKK
ncbi:NAD(P)/FAD-dependent oxidoreductase [Caproiciproducens sp.]